MTHTPSQMPDEIWLSDDGNWRFARHSGNISNEGEYNGAVKYVRADLSALEAERGDDPYKMPSAYVDAPSYTDSKTHGTPMLQPHPPAVAGDRAEDVARARKYLAELCKGSIPSMSIPVDNNDFDMVFKRMIDFYERNTPPDNADLAAVRDAVKEAKELSRLAQKWILDHGTIEAAARRMGIVKDTLEKPLAILDRMMKGA